MSKPANLHASAAIVGGFGLLVTGPSGSGKTQLCLDLIEHCRLHRLFATIVSDDQVLLEAHSGRLVATAPSTIAGLVELRGFGLAPVMHMPKMVVERLVRLVPRETAQRIANAATESLEGIALPRLDLAANGGMSSARAAIGWLGLPPFAS